MESLFGNGITSAPTWHFPDQNLEDPDAGQAQQVSSNPQSLPTPPSPQLASPKDLEQEQEQDRESQSESQDQNSENHVDETLHDNSRECSDSHLKEPAEDHNQHDLQSSKDHFSEPSENDGQNSSQGHINEPSEDDSQDGPRTQVNVSSEDHDRTSSQQNTPEDDDDENFNDFDLTDLTGLGSLPREQVYEFRDRVEFFKTLRTSMMDTDKTGNYDPAEKRERKPIVSKRKRDRELPQLPPIHSAPDSEHGLEADGEGSSGFSKRQKQHSSMLTARQNGLSLVVTLKYTSPELGQKIDELIEESDDRLYRPGYNVLLENPFVESRLRRRQETSVKQLERIPDPIENPEKTQSDLRNHPSARGCASCRQLEIDCPLLEHPEWPCKNCLNSQEAYPACSMIIPPKQKQQCQRCRQVDYDCSYSRDREQVGPCDECQDAGSPCVAGPMPGTIRLRICYDNPPSVAAIQAQIQAADRKFVACTCCRISKKTCSLKNKQDPPPCKRCMKEGRTCDFRPLKGGKDKEHEEVEDDTMQVDQQVEEENEVVSNEDEEEIYENEEVVDRSSSMTEPPQTANGQSSQAQDHTEQGSSNSQKAVVQLPRNRGIVQCDTKGNWGYLAQLVTRFSHPIKFGYVARKPSKKHGLSRGCHFCAEPLLALGGWGEPKTVEVIEWANGLGYTEQRNGYRTDENLRPIRLCWSCTLKPASIAECDHRIREMEDVQELRYEPIAKAAMDRLVRNEPFHGEHFCSFCVQYPATWRCMRHKKIDHMGNELDPQKGRRRGCGLFLCDACTKGLKQEVCRKDKPGTFESFVQKIEKLSLGPSRRPPGEPYDNRWRPDVGFMSKEGLCYKNCLPAAFE